MYLTVVGLRLLTCPCLSVAREMIMDEITRLKCYILRIVLGKNIFN
jgi:hypothetical protein